jgi:hypothetical protein
VLFLSQLPESLGLAAGLSPLRLLLGLPALSLSFATPPAILCRLGRGCAELRIDGVLRNSPRMVLYSGLQ